MLEPHEVIAHRARNDCKQDSQELDLLPEVGFAGLENRFRDVEHRFVSRKPLDLYKLIKRQTHGSENHHGPVKKDLKAREAAEQTELPFMEIRDLQIRFAGPSRALPQVKHPQ